MFKRLFFVYAAQFLEALSSETGPLSSLSPGGTSFNIQNPIPYKSQKTGFFLKHAGQKSTKEELPEQRKASKRAVECQLKASTHIWEHDVGCSSHLTPTNFIGKTACLGGFSAFWGKFQEAVPPAHLCRKDQQEESKTQLAEIDPKRQIPNQSLTAEGHGRCAVSGRGRSPSLRYYLTG